MNTLSDDFPLECLSYIFSFLEPKDVPRAARVCKKWNEALKADWLWESHCLTYLDRATPLRDSWKERFKVFRNWTNGLAEVTHYPPSYKTWHTFHVFTVLDDNTCLEIYPDPENPRTYIVRNLVNNEQVRRIDLKEFGCSNVIATDLHDTTWVALDDQRRIFCFDIQTGVCTQRIPSSVSTSTFSKIEYNGQEIIRADDHEIKIWNARTAQLEQTIDISQFGAPWTLRSTRNFVIGTFGAVGWIQGFAIQKNDHSKWEQPVEGALEACCVDSKGSRVAFLTSTGQVKVFEDIPDKGLALTQTLIAFTPPAAGTRFGRVHIYRNWLFVSRGDTLHIWDLRTGIKLSELKCLVDGSDFCANAQLLFTRQVLGDPHFHQEYSYSLYDFGRGVSRLNVHKAETKCVIM